MKAIFPSQYQAITFHLFTNVMLDATQKEFHCHKTADFPTGPLTELSRTAWKAQMRSRLVIHVDEWLDEVFANIVAEKK